MSCLSRRPTPRSVEERRGASRRIEEPRLALNAPSSGAEAPRSRVAASSAGSVAHAERRSSTRRGGMALPRRAASRRRATRCRPRRRTVLRRADAPAAGARWRSERQPAPGGCSRRTRSPAGAPSRGQSSASPRPSMINAPVHDARPIGEAPRPVHGTGRDRPGDAETSGEHRHLVTLAGIVAAPRPIVAAAAAAASRRRSGSLTRQANHATARRVRCLRLRSSAVRVPALARNDPRREQDRAGIARLAPRRRTPETAPRVAWCGARAPRFRWTRAPRCAAIARHYLRVTLGGRTPTV
jgi:hypothetical protein